MSRCGHSHVDDGCGHDGQGIDCGGGQGGGCDVVMVDAVIVVDVDQH